MKAKCPLTRIRRCLYRKAKAHSSTIRKNPAPRGLERHISAEKSSVLKQEAKKYYEDTISTSDVEMLQKIVKDQTNGKKKSSQSTYKPDDAKETENYAFEEIIYPQIANREGELDSTIPKHPEKQ